MNSDADDLVLLGLDAANPLAFLAALGTLRTLSLAAPRSQVSMRWRCQAGAWRPVISARPALTAPAAVDLLHRRLVSMADHPAFAIGDDLNLPVNQFRALALRSAADNLATGDRVFADFIAAFGSDACFSDDPNPIMADTALRTMSGAGHQHFLKFVRDLVAQTTADHIMRCLFAPWDYADEGRGLNLRWDPADDRRYALRWDDPSGDPVKTMRGANRLAIEALPLLPTMPNATGRLSTTAFHGSGARATFFCYPVWSFPTNLDVTRSILGSSLTLKEADPPKRRACGIAAVFQSQRITTGKFRNFAPAAEV